MKIDSQLQLDVLAELKWGPSVKIEVALKRRATADAHGISVEVHGADLISTGKVPSWSERSLARNCAWGTSGVQHVTDNMTVAY